MTLAKMSVRPVYNAVGKFFEHEPRFRVPKYQRSYAWGKPEIEDFLKDLEIAFASRKNGSPINHFFGGIVSVEKDVEGAVNQSEFELVDGQQRMATFTLLVSSIISIYKELLKETIDTNDSRNKKIIERRIEELQSRFIDYEQEIQRVTHTVDVLVLSKADDSFFKILIQGGNPTESRDSHKRISQAYKDLKSKVNTLSAGKNLTERLDNLEIFKQLLDADFALIHIKTDSTEEAYTLFRVLNDRGKSLTDGDLLRATTLEMLESQVSQQKMVENLWDNILADTPEDTEEYIRWIYASHTGKRAGANTLFDDFLAFFYPGPRKKKITKADADVILNTTANISKEIDNCRKLLNGNWPFTLKQPLNQWDVNRLGLLIRELRLTVTMPLLLSACNLDHKKFAELVQILERFMFRFKIIGNQHVTPAINIFYTESVKIRQSPSTYNLSNLKNNLSAIQITNDLFKNLLEELNYKDGGGNKPIKYFLITIEYYLRWYQKGAKGNPTCLDKNRIFDFASTTIEHIYPNNAKGKVIDGSMEPVKNRLGNLTILGPGDNVNASNSSFLDKKRIFKGSMVLLNNEISKYKTWNITKFESRSDEIKDIACKVFNI